MNVYIHLPESTIWFISFEILFFPFSTVGGSCFFIDVLLWKVAGEEHLTSFSKIISEIALKHCRLHPEEMRAISTVVTFNCSSYVPKS